MTSYPTLNPETPKTAEQIANGKRVIDAALQQALRGENLDNEGPFAGWQTGRVLTQQDMCNEDRAAYCPR